MPQQRLYYDYVDDQLIPYWYVLTFRYNQLDWDQTVYYFDAIKPFEFVERDEFDDSFINMSFNLSDLVFNKCYPHKIGINLKCVRKRIELHGVDPCVVRQFILQAPEINEFLEILPTKRTMEFVII
ncbi:hypothetical protein [Bacillus sp. FSL K6-3431]|uniref:hypothetical protein n=1 Tax=Bacillus sp. FSL K6-3431 TaxID=2921500 RepID=UPI0030FB6269